MGKSQQTFSYNNFNLTIMKYSALAILGSILLSNNNDCVNAFSTPTNSRGSRMSPLAMAMDAPAAPASDLPIITSRGGAPVDVRYSDFLKLVNADKVEKATFSADGTQLLGVDTEGVRLKIEALPNDPDLLTSLTNHKVDVIVLPATLFAGLFFLSRRAGGQGGGGGMGGGGGT